MATTTLTKSKPAQFKPKNYEHLIGMPGFSDKMLKNHFKLYEGYVTHTTALLEELNSISLQENSPPPPQYAEMKRRLGWEFNGMRLHEYYFDNLGGKKEELKEHALVKGMINDSFGSLEKWQKDFVASGAMRGIGWVSLYFDPISKRLFNFWVEEHNANHLAGGTPLLVMDVFEHAFMIDYGTDKAKYMEAFFNNINWQVVASRCEGLLGKKS